LFAEKVFVKRLTSRERKKKKGWGEKKFSVSCARPMNVNEMKKYSVMI